MNKLTNYLKTGVLIGGIALLAFAFVGTGTAEAYTFTLTMRTGSTGIDVLELQKALNTTATCKVATVGAGSPGFETSHFGPKTQAAVRCFQSTSGLAVDGVVGPNTRAALNSAFAGVTGTTLPSGCMPGSTFSSTTGLPCTVTNLPAGCLPGYMFSPLNGQPCTGSTSLPAGCTSTIGYSPTTGIKCDSTTSQGGGSLAGNDGTISDVDTLSQYNDEEVAEGQKDITIAGFDLEASRDGDIRIRSVRVTFDPDGNDPGDSDRLKDYIGKVSIWMGSKEIGSASVDDFSKNRNDTFSRTITVSSDAIVRAGKSAQFLIKVDAARTHDSGDIDSDSWTVIVESIRYEDGSGVVSTDSTTGDLGDAIGIGTDGGAGDGISIDFVSFSQAANTEFRISRHADNPKAGVVVVSDTGSTDDVVLLKGRLEVKGSSDVTMDEFLVTLSPTDSTFQSMVESITLVLDGEEYSESVPAIAAGASATLTFDNLDFTIDAGDTIEFSILVEIADIDDFTPGSTITASITATNRGSFDLENEQGDQLTANERAGTAGGEAQEFRENGIVVELISANAEKSAVDADNGDTGVFTIRFRVTAVGDNIYIASVASPDGAMANAYVMDISGTATTTDQSAVFVNITDATLSGGVYLIEEGESETFELTVVRNASATDGLYRISLTGIRWDTDEDSTPDNLYTTKLDQFRTSYIFLD